MPTESQAVDEQIGRCLDINAPRSFFLFAGAGSGKTRSLVNALLNIRDRSGHTMRLRKQRVAVITYTNAACDEILNRVDHDPLFQISTIHSFAWRLIRTYQSDIRSWVKTNLENEIAELQQELAKGRAGTKASIDRQKKIESKKNRLSGLAGIKKFTYNPNGDNRTRDSLNHAEVIKICADFLSKKIMMRNILVSAFPVLLIDESQDTNKLLMDALFEVQKLNAVRFSLGLFGDVMQRIYADGKPDLGTSLPPDWAKPAKTVNHRSAKRIVRLVNRIRKAVDEQRQTPIVESDEGHVRLFIVRAGEKKDGVEDAIFQLMASQIEDPDWNSPANLKVLILEHRMAASRMGFMELFDSLHSVERLKTSLLDGSLPGLRFFSQLICPLVRSSRIGDKFSIARVIRENSPLLDKETLRGSSDQLASVRKVNEAVQELLSFWDQGKDPKLIDILYFVSEAGLFEIPDSLLPIALRDAVERETVSKASEIEEADEDDTEVGDEVLSAWDKALQVSFSQLEKYEEYVTDRARFGTHQGVKGLEFPRVAVIIDDDEAKGFLFNYEKLFGSETLSATDRKNISEGKETSLDRTRRLFYVTCSRAKQSLAIIAYTKSPDTVKNYVCSQGWFEEKEVTIVR